MIRFKVVVYVGTLYNSDVQNQMDGHFPIYVNLSDAIFHENYTDLNYEHDIALIKLPFGLKFNETVSSVKLPQEGYELNLNEIASVSGWGMINTNGTYPKVLLKVDFIVISNEQCQERLRNAKEIAMRSVNITMNHLCTFSNESRGVFIGDSGSGLVQRVLDHQELIGIVSGADEFEPEQFPAVLTRISQHLNWIYDKMAQLA